MNPTNQPKMNALLEQLADILEQTDLSRQERAQFCVLLGEMRAEVGICQEVAA
ncbi:hypothetical protein ACU6QH_11500 [Aeromonas veronii]|uniref:hypothetical protein n=1 Tax=Aeromonas TaxID=642 RepID=UPI0012F6F89C|nr:hypothetical protein [Aeromonas veronii]MBL0637908.1 hypothetical protein [Aeromonas veronii]MCF5881774.1 hypothetical protein [Aeromonas veronii]MCF5889918.1 hypothetical protein [Aeromonas veronii]MDX7746017.1 hypothetical protein [Aeromonas veronii]MEB5669028.1 hypothetical protein [Aeromonas veronii]